MAVLTYNSKCRAAASVQNVSYILREDACATWGSHNLEEVISKSHALSYADRRAWEEEMRSLNGASERRNHQRMVLTFPEESNPDRALAAAKNFLKQEFPEGKAILAAHGNTKIMHVHVWMDCRKTDGKKLHVPNAQYKTLDDRFAKYADRLYNTNYAEQFKAQKIANISERETLKAAGQSSKIVRKQNSTWKKRKEANAKNEQRTARITESIIEAASRVINESARTIDGIKQINQYGNQLELARIGREGSERKRRSNDPQGGNPIPSPAKAKKQPRRNRL
jgi:hypothetical protein